MLVISGTLQPKIYDREGEEMCAGLLSSFATPITDKICWA